MIAPLAKFIDRLVLQIGHAMLPQSTWREAAHEQDLKLEQTVQFLNGPDFLPTESQPAQLDFIPDASGGRFRFPSPRPCEFAENNVNGSTTDRALTVGCCRIIADTLPLN